MSKCGNLWAIGFDDTERAAQVRDEVTKLGWEKHDLILLDVAVAVLYPDGSFTLNGEPLAADAQIDCSTFRGLLGCLALAAPPLTGAAVSALLGRCGAERAAVGISDDFVRVVEALIKPGTSVLFVLDDGGNMDAVLHGIHGLGGTVLRTNVDLEHAKLIQSTLAAPNDSSQPSSRLVNQNHSGRSCNHNHKILNKCRAVVPFSGFRPTGGTSASTKAKRTKSVSEPSEAKMIVTNYFTEDLKKLPLRAIVALSARCARRVEHLALLPADHPQRERCRTAVVDAIRLADDFAKGLPCPTVESVVREAEASRAVVEGEFVRESAMDTVVLTAHAAATALRALALRGEPVQSSVFGAAKANPFPHLADVTADLAARDAFTAAEKAACADGHCDKIVKAAVDDYCNLLRLDLGSYPQAGIAIDPSSTGPLGQL